MSVTIMFLLVTFILVVQEYYKWGLLTYLLCIVTYFLKIYSKHIEVNNQENLLQKYNGKGLHIAEMLYEKFRTENKDVDKQQYILEISRLYTKYKVDHTIECNNSNFSCFCAYLDFEYYASEYLTYLPKF